MTWSEDNGQQLATVLAPYTVRTVRQAKRLVRLTVRYLSPARREG